VKAVIYAFLEDMDNREKREAGEDLAAFGLPQALECAKQKYPTREERHQMFGEPGDGTLFAKASPHQQKPPKTVPDVLKKSIEATKKLYPDGTISKERRRY
jgi:hypothetical protein